MIVLSASLMSWLTFWNGGLSRRASAAKIGEHTKLMISKLCITR